LSQIHAYIKHRTSNIKHFLADECIRISLCSYLNHSSGRGLLENATLKNIAKRHDATPTQIALAWVLRQPGVIAIPKASNDTHVRDNARSIEIQLTDEDFADIDHEFPPPKSKQPLPML